MNISIGIVGLPNTGKSTLFNALTKKAVPAENFPFCTIDPAVGVVPVPDERLEKLGKMSASKEIVPTVIEFVDIAGLVRGASEGEGLGNAFLSHIREVDAIAHTVRCFLDDSVTHVDGEVNPVRDIEVIETELLLADIQLAERRLEKVEKEVKRGTEEAIAEKALLEEALTALREGRMVASLSLDDEKQQKLCQLGLLTGKPVMFVCNIGAHDDERCVAQVQECAARTGSEVVTVSAQTEQELSVLDPKEAKSIREELAVVGGGLDAIIQTAYKTLGYISFFTTGEKETRAWAIPKGSTAPQAGGAIHTDFEKNFIRAETIAYDELLATGSYATARETGKLRLEGKDYHVQDGDVIIFRHG
ncbi:MAG: redox-regulated ATPase YchF [Candidatus Kaiserbacteria bacterium]|nr:redox-regulated ATPase YchF [Candidatus Kaiserbacteria bacterium]